MRRNSLYLFSLTVLLLSCSKDIRIASHCQDSPEIWPDYKDVTIPYNIAPLCFSVEGIADAGVIMKGQTDSIVLTSADGSFNPPAAQWRSLLEREKGRSLAVTVCRKTADGTWQSMRPFKIHVSADSIDSHVVYRRITPGYGLWNRMGIYQRSLEDFEENAIYENGEGRGNCVNCHSFCNGDPDKWQLHIRMRYGGTYLFDGGEQSLLELQDKSHGNPVYPSWHPDGRLVAYSNNSTFFFIHTRKSNRWEVMDDKSDVFVVDINTGEQFRSPLVSSEDSFETYPCFSPDGKWLYFCTAKAHEEVVSEYDSVRYSICRIAFDAVNRTFGERVDTIYKAEGDHGSASFPRVSPDGRWLCFTRSSYGNFSICHRDADLCIIDLENPDGYRLLSPANSKQVDSFHSWSRNSRWLVFSSKRDDGIYTRLYFAHVDKDGRAAKAFLLPQRDAKNFYDLLMDGYNIPELVAGRVGVSKIRLRRKGQAAQSSASVN